MRAARTDEDGPEAELGGEDGGARGKAGLERLVWGRWLKASHRRAPTRRGEARLQEGEQVHALVLRLLEERVYPPIVAAEVAKRTEVAVLGGDHARDGGDRLEEDEAEGDRFGRRVRRLVARHRDKLKP